MPNVVAQACAAGAAFLLFTALWPRPDSGTFLGPVTDERDISQREALHWKHMLLRSVVSIVILQAELTAISAVLPL
ncbi:hypothetical protein ACIBQ1_03445 [Nonomuraea sp. NPDC050153]|uniref:hypothetical protein n=1 Tax=Nonomuraea sp. NPDC050153 TaxID=3364359 RepID=UPI0037B9DD1E